MTVRNSTRARFSPVRHAPNHRSLSLAQEMTSNGLVKWNADDLSAARKYRDAERVALIDTYLKVAEAKAEASRLEVSRLQAIAEQAKRERSAAQAAPVSRETAKPLSPIIGKLNDAQAKAERRAAKQATPDPVMTQEERLDGVALSNAQLAEILSVLTGIKVAKIKHKQAAARRIREALDRVLHGSEAQALLTAPDYETALKIAQKVAKAKDSQMLQTVFQVAASGDQGMTHKELLQAIEEQNCDKAEDLKRAAAQVADGSKEQAALLAQSFLLRSRKVSTRLRTLKVAAFKTKTTLYQKYVNGDLRWYTVEVDGSEPYQFTARDKR